MSVMATINDAGTSAAGYLRFPSIHQQRVVFVFDDDLWSVELAGGTARRLTAGLGQAELPVLSPDGQHIAYTGRDEGDYDAFVIAAEGGQPRRITYFGQRTMVVGFDGPETVIVQSNAHAAATRYGYLYRVRLDGTGLPQQIPVGPAREIALGGPGGASVVGRFTRDPALWKRYKGGTKGDLWIDANGDGTYRRLLDLDGHLAAPRWLNGRIYFVADHEGYGNLYSCAVDGTNLKRHTDHTDYYVRNPQTDGERLVYQCGGEIYVYEPREERSRKVEVAVPSQRTQLGRRFVPARKHLEHYGLHPDGRALTVTSRGKAFTLPNWEQAPRQFGETSGAVRYRLATYLHDGERMVLVSDAPPKPGEDAEREVLEVHPTDPLKEAVRLDGYDFGRAVTLVASPTANEVVLTNQRFELIHVKLDEKTFTVLDRSEFDRMETPAFSADGRWVAYSFAVAEGIHAIKVYDLKEGVARLVTKPDMRDFAPAFDPKGKYLYFLSYRVFDPVFDSFTRNLSFPAGCKPFLITLQKETPSPFEPEPKGFGKDDEDSDDEDDGDDGDGDDGDGDKGDGDKGNGDNGNNESAGSESEEKASGGSIHTESEGKQTGDAESEETGGGGGKGKKKKKKEKPPKPVIIDFDGIEERVLAFDVDEARYGQIVGLEGKVLWTSMEPEGTLSEDWPPSEDKGKATLSMYDFKTQETNTLAEEVDDFTLSRDRSTLCYRGGKHLRVIKAGEEAPKENEYSRKGGWIDLSRLRIAVEPRNEWRQMAREAWRLMRDHFWVEDMSGHDWPGIWRRYLPLLERVSTRSEFSDLMWELQGELGTSHAYEFLGDYPQPPRYHLGYLGADLRFDEATGRYHVEHLVRGDSWLEEEHSPLKRPGVNVAEGDTLLAVAGQPVSRERPPQALLVNQAGNTVELTVGDANGENPRTVAVKLLASEHDARYREWVETNRAYVHAQTQGRVGYLHIPDMSVEGFAEFHRYYMREVRRDALIVDVRYNGGGFVSQFILEKLARKRIGYDLQRYGPPAPYPADSVLGPMVALTNESAGSDGDIFSHCFKLMKLGTLIGKRTWGGVIGIWPRHSLVDGTITTQPEFSFWFEDVGFKVENYGTDPHIDVDIAPQDYAAERDPQMEKALEVISEEMEKNPPRIPDFGPLPKLAPGPLPPRH